MRTSTTPLSREFLLVAACCCWPADSTNLEIIRTAATPPLDWNKVIRIVARHRVDGLVNNALIQAHVAVPHDIMAVLGKRAKSLAEKNLYMAAEALRIQNLFARENISVLFIKGLPVARLAYGNLGIRHSKDIDLLIAPRDIEQAEALLERSGYRRQDPPSHFTEAQARSLRLIRKNSSYVHERLGHEVELHWRLFDNPGMLGGITVMSSQRNVPLASGISLPTLNEEDTFAYLCAHGANDGWFRLKWLADIAALIAQSPGNGTRRLYEAAVTRGAGPAAAQALLLCQRLLHTTLPPSFAVELAGSVRARWLERIGLWATTSGNEEIALPDIPFGGTRIMFSHFLLGRGWRYWLMELRIALTSTQDMAMLSLPQSLSFFYPFLRVPLWILRRLKGWR